MGNRVSRGVEICLLVILLPFIAILLAVFFQGTDLTQGFSTLIQHLPFVDSFTLLFRAAKDIEQFSEMALGVILKDFLSTILLGCAYSLFKGIASVLALDKLPIVRAILYFVIIILCGILLNGINLLGGIGAILAELGSIIIMLISLYIMGGSLFAKLPSFSNLNITKMVLGLIIDAIVAVILTAYLTLVNLCLQYGFDVLVNGFWTFLGIIIITIVAVVLDAFVQLGLNKDGV